MNIKNILCIATIAVSFITNAQSSPNLFFEGGRPFLTSEEAARALMRKPRDRTKTPITPDVVEHKFSDKTYMKIITTLPFPKLFERKCIFYGKDKYGNPCYRRIREHADDSEFANVELVIYNPKGWIYSESFEKIGTFADKNAVDRLKKTIANGGGGLWCPEQNAFIGGTRETGKPNPDGTPTRNMCEEYQRFFQQHQQTSKFKK